MKKDFITNLKFDDYLELHNTEEIHNLFINEIMCETKTERKKIRKKRIERIKEIKKELRP